MSYVEKKGSARYCSASLLLLAVSILTPSILLAENGVGDDLAARFAVAELVAQVQIAGIYREVDSALSGPGMVAISGYIYSAISHQVWKGESGRLIAFRLGLDVCARKLEKGAHYLIFATADSRGRLQLHSCDAAVAEADAAPLLARLKQFKKQG